MEEPSMPNGEASRIHLNPDGTINLEVKVSGFDEGTPIEISGQLTQPNGAVGSFYSVQEMPAHTGESAVLTLKSIAAVPPTSFEVESPITVISRVTETPRITTLESDSSVARAVETRTITLEP